LWPVSLKRTDEFKVAEANVKYGKARMPDRLDLIAFFAHLELAKCFTAIGDKISDVELPPERSLIEDLDPLLRSERMVKVDMLMLPSDPHDERPLLRA
jgi:hypothetical protein